MVRYVTIVGLALAFSPSVVFAEPHKGDGAEQRACRADAV